MARFSIRDILWLTVVAAFAVGWFMDRTAFQRQRAQWNADEAALKAVVSKAEKGVAAIRKFNETIDHSRYNDGYSRGVEAEQKAQAARDKEQSRLERGVPATQQEARPGIYYLQ
jgi:hypothetical protein